jgi:class 3 adenylate cyclase/tetratricopeptide (TPR) repeat protein
MSPLDVWLDELGLAKYGKAFAENDIDLDVLPDLTDGDLAALGLTLGHRRKLMAAAARLRGAAEQPPARVSEASQQVERRQVTVLFTDLVGSTAMSVEFDPEDMRALLREYQGRCAAAIAHHEGFLARYLGDGVLAYFGFPFAHEHDAEHAVRAGLDILHEVAKIHRPGGKPLETRVGIATGLVIVGEIIGEGASQEHNIVGETPNLAARLQALAQPNEIVVSQRTHQLLGKQFVYEDMGRHPLKGFPAPVQAWGVLGEAATETRFAARHTENRGAFVGRGEESSLLNDRWRRATQNHGHAVLITGEAGMGKSRLSNMLSESISDERCYRVTWQCSPYHTNSALYPVIRRLERVAGFAAEDTVAQKLAKLEALLGGADMPAAPAPALIAALLALPVDGYPPIDLAPPQRKAATLAALAALLVRLAADMPMLLLIEDVHWLDPTTTELCTRLIDGVGSTRLLILITARPEFVSPWSGRANFSCIEVTRLAAAEAAALVADIAAPHVLESAIVGDIVAKGDGVPLYLEELTRSVLESATPERPVVPATLHDSLMARLDRLGPAREIAQVAAVIGQQFSYALLSAVAGGSEASLIDGLHRLAEAGIVFQSGPTAGLNYTFKHALMRDVAYENQLRAKRGELHRRIGSTLIDDFPAIAESEPELVAYHFRCAGMCDLACTYGERAGDRAALRSSFVEALAHFNAALAEAEKITPEAQRTRRELDLLLKMGPPLCGIKSPQSPEVAELYQRARDHAAALKDDAETFKATWGLWFNTIQGRWLDRARDHAEALVTLAGRTGEDDLMLEGIHCRWSTAMFRGEVVTALNDSREGIKRYDREKHSWLGPVFGGHDPGVCACGVSGIAFILAGRPNESRQCFEQAISLAENLRHPGSLAHAVMNATNAALFGRDYCEADRFAQHLLELANKYNLPPMRTHALFMSGCAQAFTSDSEAGMAAMEGAFSPAFSTGPMFRVYAAALAEGREKQGRFKDALNVLAAAIATITEPGVGLYISELYRLQGMCLLQAEPAQADEAMQSLRTAVDIARRQGATVLEVRAATSFAQAAAATGTPAGGLDPLRDLLARLPPEFEASGLAEARRLLSA